jgi:hypothetical protein
MHAVSDVQHCTSIKTVVILVGCSQVWRRGSCLQGRAGVVGNRGYVGCCRGCRHCHTRFIATRVVYKDLTHGHFPCTTSS